MNLLSILKENLAPALQLKEEDAAICNGTHEEVAKAHRDFAKASAEERAALVTSGEF